MRRTFQFFALLALIFGSLGITPASAASQPATEQFLNADGSLDLTTGYSGTLDASAYSVTLDPARGPIFSPLAVTANAWNALGTGLNGLVNTIAISGTDVYVGGLFTNAGGDANADNVAKWDGSTWSALGTGLNNEVNSIAISGMDVYVGGTFTDAGGNANADYIAKWDGSSWSALGTGLIFWVNAIATSGTDVYVGGPFIAAGGVTGADYIAKWDGSAWSALGSTPLNNEVNSIAISGTDVYAGGVFIDAGGDANADRIAKWDGSTWSALGAGLNDRVNTVAASGTDVYAGGYFTDAGGAANADYLAKWNGSTWSALGSTPLNNVANDIVINGMGVYAGGHFTDAGGNPNADYIALYATCTTPITVTNANDSGSGSLREALTNVCPGGTITFDNDYHILLDSTLAVTKDLTIDGETHKIILDGQNTVRVMYTEWSPVSATVKNLTIQNGHADTILGVGKSGGGILNLGKLNVENVTFSNNTAVDNGGALYSWDVTWVVNSTFSGNSAANGGAIYDESAGYSTGMVIHNTTFSGNSATVSGGAIDATLGAVNIHYSIIANSTSGGNCAGNVINAAPNLDSGSTCGFGISNTDPKLAPLADNGGPTPTFALLAGSPAINVFSSFFCNSVDQRGAARPQGAKCDLGSYEAFIVTNANDSGAGSLRQNLVDVIPNGPIIFDNDYTILLDSTLAITKNLTIDGIGHTIILDGQNTVRVMYTEWSPVSAAVKNLTIQNGKADTSVGVIAKAGGGILNLGSLQVENVTFHNNAAVDSGGALYSYDSALTVAKSTFSNNSATNGGGIYVSSGTTTVTNSAFAGNPATSGGGIYLFGGTATVTNSTLAENSATNGGGIFNFGGTLNLRNTILANSTSGGDCVGSTASASNNLIESTGSFDCGLTNGVNGNIIGSDPNLGPLANNGGSTLTFSLLAGSPALNAGSDAVCAGADVGGQDQRGVTRPQGAHCDIGSYEVNFYTVTFNANGGSGSMPPQAANVPTALTLNAFTRAGNIFTGWNAAADGSDAAYDDGATYNFSADITLYAQWLDVTAPNTTITVKPAALTTSKNASFSFTSTEAGSTFMCKLEGANYSPCSSPKAYTNLSTTSHTFQVYAVDASGNPDSTPAIYTWTVRAERAKNGGFNTYAGASKIPTSWVKSTNFSASDGKDTSIKKDGAASVKIIGQTGKTKTLTQTLNINGVAGEKFTFSFWERGSAIPASGICRAQVLLYQGAAIKLTKTINCRTGTYNAFEKKTLSFNAPASFNKVVIKFTYSKTSGMVWFDLVSLIK